MPLASLAISVSVAVLTVVASPPPIPTEQGKTTYDPDRHGMPFQNVAPGICGGLTFASLDHFHANFPAVYPSGATIGVGAIRLWLNQRQDHSLAKDGGRYLEAVTRSQADLFTDSIGLQWRRLKTAIDAGKPVAIGLIASDRLPTSGHVVVAFRYRRDSTSRDVGAGTYTITIDDPNHPDRAVLSPRGAFTLTLKPSETVWRHSGVNGSTAPGLAPGAQSWYRGFFVVDGYQPKEPLAQRWKREDDAAKARKAEEERVREQARRNAEEAKKREEERRQREEDEATRRAAAGLPPKGPAFKNVRTEPRGPRKGGG